MNQPRVEGLREIREDGRVIEPGMSVDEMIARGWQPSKVPRLEWTCGERTVVMTDERGFLCRVLPDKSGVAIIVGGSARILNADGSLRLDIPQQLSGNGRTYSGHFAWFERPHTDSAIALVLKTDSGDYRFDIHAQTGAVLSCSWTK